MNIEKMRDLIQFAKKAELRRTGDNPTVFSIMGNSHHENPISNILQFFFNPKANHPFGTLFLDALFDCLNQHPRPTELNRAEKPEREIDTGSGGRMDLIISGPDWVVAIENKIFSGLQNPLDNYRFFVQNNYRAMPHKYFIVLSIYPFEEHEEWQSVLHADLVKRIEDRLPNVPHEKMRSESDQTTFLKWFFILKDFILHIKHLSRTSLMDNKTFDFYAENYADIRSIESQLLEFIDAIRQRSGKQLSDALGQSVTSSKERWSSTWAIIYAEKSWRESKIRLLIHDDGSIGIDLLIKASLCPSASNETSLDCVSSALQEIGFNPSRKNEGDGFFWYGHRDEFHSLSEALNALSVLGRTLGDIVKERDNHLSPPELLT